MRWLELDHANLEQALRVARERAVRSKDAHLMVEYANDVLSLERYWNLSGRKHPAAEALRQLIESFGARLDPPTLARARLALGSFLHTVHREESRRQLQEALEIFTAEGDRGGRARALQALTATDVLDLNFEDAEARISEALPIFEAEGNGLRQTACRVSRGNILYRQNRLEDAAQLLDEVIPQARRDESPFELIAALVQAGSVAWGRGKLEVAERIFEEALEFAREFPRSTILPIVHFNLGNVYTHLGNETRATMHWRLGARLGLRGGQDLIAAMCQIGMTRYVDYRERRRLYVSSIGIFLRERDMLYVLAILRAMARELIEPDPRAGIEGHPREGAALLGFEEAYRREVGAPMIEQQVADFERHRSCAEAVLTPEELAEAWSEGERLTVEAAVDLAMGSLPDPDSREVGLRED